MRVIAGISGGLKLKTLDGEQTRPTGDRVKEALFSSLSDKLNGAKILDAFAGSGALAIEALSRGAKAAVLCENNKAAYNICELNLKNTHTYEHAKLILTDAISYVRCAESKFDIIFLDPPYAGCFYENFLKEVAIKGLLNEKGIVVVEYEEKNLPVIPDSFQILKTKKYGRVHLSFLSIAKDEAK
ncbi:MAG: 16S rRNA (guanine(966)-N(2))-methyltransferase RsmD [Bacillota bacterium]|nr:16S rRNA (guanine(966)-N(2))-methyltransferase RsmD [Bacillota bacterium]